MPLKLNLKSGKPEKFKVTIAPEKDGAAVLVLLVSLTLGEDENSIDLHAEIVGME